MNHWRRYNIFLSSTFKDMDFERDVIKFRVIPALNRRFRDRRIELQAIDLRLGVNTAKMSEEESERKVLSVCTSCIDSARPFFIGLIGQRYGWIPPVERWKEFMAGLAPEERDILKNTAGCSVTEMEIVYGALSEGSFDSSHVLFFLRDEASYSGMPDNLLPTFCDSDPQVLGRLESLKSKIRRIFSERAADDDRCTPYHLDWHDGRFSSDEFEALVTDQLARQIEIETASEDAAGTAIWWAAEKELEESTLLRLLPEAVDLGIYDDTDGASDTPGGEDEAPGEEDDASGEEDEAPGGESSDMAVWYCHGLGATTRMAQEYARWDGDEDVVRLLAVFGLSEYSTSMRPVVVRWIHELHSLGAGKALPEDELMLAKMPETELYSLLEELVSDISESRYVYIYLDDVEALETSSAKDLYMPWLDRIRDRVNVMINLLDGSEARAKFLEAHPYLSRKMILGIQTDTTAEAEMLIANYEKIYCLELPEKVRLQMLDALSESSERVITPIQVHSIFRIFESLTQEDFREIRSREGSQIDAINSYLEEIWDGMADDPYDIMTDIVNTIVRNLSIGGSLRHAIWLVAAAPGGLRELDVAYFAGEDWDEVQFHRAMNFLPDFFYEDRTRHLWRAKYITRPEDGLADKQREISGYLLTLDNKDSLRETMGLYYALGGGDTTHFASYMVEGDYVAGTRIGYAVRFYGPQIRQLLREGFLDSDGFERYCRALPSCRRLQLMMFVLTGLADLPDDRDRIHRRMSAWLEDVSCQGLAAPDAFALASILASSASVACMEKALSAARCCKEQGYPNADRLYSSISSLLIVGYQKSGDKRRAEELQREVAAGQKTADERFAALNALVARASAPSVFGKKKNAEALDRFFDEYHSIAASLEVTNENMRVRYNSSIIMMNALGVLMNGKRYERLLAEAVRFIPTMKILYLVPNFFTQAATLQIFVQLHLMIFAAASSLDESFARLADLSAVAASEGGRFLNELDPDNKLLAGLRSRLSHLLASSASLRDQLGIPDTKLAALDGLIEAEYAGL